MESGTTIQAHACSAAQTFKIFQSVESRQRRTNEQTKKETDRRTRALRWVTSQRVTLKHPLSSIQSIHMTHRWCKKGHARSGSLRDSFRQRGHASHRCALRVGSRVSKAPALERSVSLFCVTLKSWFQWNGGSRSKIILFKAVWLIDLSGWRRTPQNCGYEVLRGLNPLLRNMTMTPFWVGISCRRLCSISSDSARRGRRGVCPRLRWEDSQIDYHTRVAKEHGHRMSKSA